MSLRLPVEAFREALFRPGGPQWPPADLARTGLQLALLAPGGATLFDSATAREAQPPLSLDRLAAALAPGETLTIHRGTRVVALLHGAEDASAPPS
ncbi:ATP-binding protein, partial [Pelomonas sp. HMWF004]